LRLELRQAEHTVEEWPQALRWVAEDRLRHQLEVFGIPRVKTIPYNASVVVKRKRWHDAGVLAPPYVNARVLAPDPKMFDGWVVKTDEGRVLHVREALVPNPLGEMVALELKENTPEEPGMDENRRFRLTGKQKPPEIPFLKWPSGEQQKLVEPPKELEVECDYSPTTPGSPHLDLGLEKMVGPKKLFGGETFKEGHQKVQGVEKSVFIDDTKSLALEKSQLGEKRNELLGEKGISEKCLGLSLGELLGGKGISEKCLGLSLGELLGEKGNQLLGEKGLNEKCLRSLLGELLGEKGII